MKKYILIFLAAAYVARAHASILVTAPTASAPGSFTVTAPITFSINVNVANGNPKEYAFVLQNWVTSDGTMNQALVRPNLSFSVNDQPINEVATFFDNFAGKINANDVSANDGYIYFVTQPIAAGNTLTLSAGTYTLDATANFNPQATQAFNGDMFVVIGTGARISNIVSAGNVPEPSTWAALIAGAGLLGAAAMRRGGPRPQAR